MWRRSTARLVLAVALVWSQRGVAAETVLTLDKALALARERGPAAVAARGEIDEAKGRRIGAGILLRENPEAEALVGSRSTDSGSSIDYEIGVGQVFELGGRRGARIRGADAGVTRAKAGADDTLRVLLRDVTIAFYRVVHADERLKLAQSAESIAAELLATAQRRYQAGDIADLDLNLARIAVARAHGDVRQAEAARVRVIGELKVLLGLSADDDVQVSGDLQARHTYRVEELLAQATKRPDLTVLDAEAREAQADVDLGDGFGWPDLGVAVAYHQEAGEEVILGGILLRFPIFDRGQELRATGRARKNRVTGQAASLRQAIAVQVQTAFEVHAKLASAADEYKKDVLGVLDDNEGLARKSFDAGQIGVAEYVLIRREILEARGGYLDRLLELAVAAAELEATAGESR